MIVTPISLIVTSYVHIVMSVLKTESTQGCCKAFSICVSHITMVSFFYDPATAVHMNSNSSYSPERDKQIFRFHNGFTALLQPVVYFLRNKDIIEGISQGDRAR